MIDYRKMLKLYIKAVGEAEGVFFVGEVRGEQLDGLSPEEGEAFSDVYDEVAAKPVISKVEHLKQSAAAFRDLAARLKDEASAARCREYADKAESEADALKPVEHQSNRANEQG